MKAPKIILLFALFMTFFHLGFCHKGDDYNKVLQLTQEELKKGNLDKADKTFKEAFEMVIHPLAQDLITAMDNASKIKNCSIGAILQKSERISRNKNRLTKGHYLGVV